MSDSFLVLAENCRQVAVSTGTAAAAYARDLEGGGFSHVTVDHMLGKAKLLLAAAELLTTLAPHEEELKALRGALTDFPSYSADTSSLVIGSTVLVRGKVHTSVGDYHQVSIGSPYIQTQVWVPAGDVVGIKRSIGIARQSA
jgi:hypothetical protein